MISEHIAPDDSAGEDDTEDPLPDAPLFALLRTIESDLGPESIDRVWLFPPRRLETGETAVVVVGAYHEVDPDRRRVFAAHYTAPAEADEARMALDEYGTAPAERVGRLVEDVVERIKDNAPAQPARAFRIERNGDQWNSMLHQLAEQYLEEASRRFRP